MTAAEEQRLDLACAYRILAHHNVIDAYGHVSVRSVRVHGWRVRERS